MPDAPLVLVTGATGAIGPRIVEACLAAGYRVRTLSRHPPPAGTFPAHVEIHVGDVTDPRSVRRAVAGATGVLHLAALLHIVDPPPELRDRYEAVNAGGTRSIVDESIQAGVHHVVLFSTINVYGSTGGRIVTERDAPAPASLYGQSKLRGEQIVLDARGSDGHPIGTVLRLGAVYGARLKGNYSRLLDAVRKGRFIHIGPGTNRRTLLYDRDAARAALVALFNPAAAGEVFNVSDGTFHTINDIVAAMASAVQVPVPRFRLPLLPLTLAAPLADFGARAIGLKAPSVRAALATFTEDVTVDSSRIQRELGFRPATTLAQGWVETARELDLRP